MKSINAVDVIVCTYKRPEDLRRLLDSLCKSRRDDCAVRVIVVDNDRSQSAREVCDSYKCPDGVCVKYLVQPEQNISKARNMGIDATSAECVAFVDDDEVVSSDWLFCGLAWLESDRGNVILGPVLPVYDKQVPSWIVSGGFFERNRFKSGSVIPLEECRTGNFFIDGKLLRKPINRFDVGLGLSGGEDYVFFKNIIEQGARPVWCDEAVVLERVPVDRATTEWLERRSFRIGSVEASLARRSGIYAVIRVIAKSSWYLTKSLILQLIVRDRVSIVKIARRKKIALGIFYGLRQGPFLEYQCSDLK